MDPKDFRGILKKYLQGRATAQEKTMIDSWYANMGKYFHSSFNRQEESDLEDKYWTKISSHITTTKTASRRMVHWYAVGVAASLLIAVASYIYWIYYDPGHELMMASSSEAIVNQQQIINSGTDVQKITLPDESKVTLQPSSKLTYAGSFDGSERTVFLDGEAFFEITSDVNRPFFVYTKNVATKVLGTSFTVKAFLQEKNVIVEVRTGKVSVFTYQEAKEEHAANTSGIILTPNQKIVYDKEENTLSRMIVEQPLAILPAEELKRMRFEAAPVKEIFDALEKVYGVDLVYDEASISACTLTTSISDGDIYNRLAIICVAIGASYELKGDHILIQGAGCNNQ